MLILSQANKWAPVSQLSLNMQGGPEWISRQSTEVLVSSFGLPLCPPPPFFALPWKHRMHQGYLSKTSLNDGADVDYNFILLSTQELSLGSKNYWLSEGYFVSALKSLQGGLFSPIN